MQKLPKLPKLFDATGLEAPLFPLAKRIVEWTRAVQDYLAALKRFIETEDFHRADRIGKTELSQRLPEEGQVLTATKAGQQAEWRDAASGDTVSVWMPDAPPASPSDYDDEFTEASLDAKWSEFDPGSSMVPTIDTTRKMAVLTDATGSGYVAGIVQPIPNVEMVIYMHWFAFGAAGSPSPAIILPSGLGSSDDLFTLYVGAYRNASSTPGIAAFAHNDYTGLSGTAKGSAVFAMTPAYLRLRLPNDGNFYVDASPDGVGWCPLFNNSLGVLPAYFGVGLWTQSGIPGHVRYPFFRVITGSGSSVFEANHIGRYVSVGV